MPTKATGQCLCGAVTYEVEMPEKSIYEGLCHCKDCQRYTGTAFASSVMVARDKMTLRGELKLLSAGTLDDPSLYHPKINIFTRSAHPHVFEIDKLSKREDGV